MADIKTRESLHTVKTFDRVQNLAAKTRKGVDEAKQETEKLKQEAEQQRRFEQKQRKKLEKHKGH